MTVRAHKPEFNFREKLKELERPIGVKGNELMGAETAQDARDLVSAGRKNLIINGDMRISQRVGTTSSNANHSTYLLDRYRWDKSSSGQLTAQQVTDAPPGFHNSMKLTVTSTDTSIASGEYYYFRQIVEGNNINHLNWGSSNAKTVTLSFWVKSSILGDHGGCLWNNAFSRSFPFNYTINSANAWEHKSITVPGCPDGTWESGTDRGINVGFAHLIGSTYTGTPGQWNHAGDLAPTSHVNLLATNGATWYITGIQLEVGSNATDFEYRSFGEELALCQRYYYEYPKGNTYNIIANGFSNATTNAIFHFQFPVPMRDAPAVATTGNWHVIDGTSHSISGFSAITDATTMTGRVDATSSGLTVGRGCQLRNNNDATATFSFNAEL